MKIKTQGLTGAALNWAVGAAEGRQPGAYKGVVRATAHPDCPDSAPMFGPELNYSTDWAQGGPIIEREGITLRCGLHGWDAELEEFDAISHGPTALVAAMRGYCSFKLGDEVDVPEELM